MHFQGIQVRKLQCGTRNERNSMYDCMIDFIILLHSVVMTTVQSLHVKKKQNLKIYYPYQKCLSYNFALYSCHYVYHIAAF